MFYVCACLYRTVLSLESFQTRAALPRSASHRSWGGSLFHFLDAVRQQGGGRGWGEGGERVDFFSPSEIGWWRTRSLV